MAVQKTHTEVLRTEQQHSLEPLDFGAHSRVDELGMEQRGARDSAIQSYAFESPEYFSSEA